MLPTIQAALKRGLAAAAEALFDVRIDNPAIEVPRDLAHGDLATPIAFEIAKRVKAATGEKRPPRAIAEALAARLGEPEHAVEGVSRLEVAGAGYVNAFVDRGAFLRAVAAAGRAPRPAVEGKVLVEHTSVNPNKAAHVGHMRNAVLGDSVVRLLRAAGQTVEVQNWIDNTGVQVADVVVGFLHVEPHTFDEVKAIPDPFDRYCWDLYAKVGLYYRDGRIDGPENKERLALRAAVQHAIEANDGEVAEMAQYVALRNAEAHLRTFLRLGIEYDVLPCESEVLHQNFWAEAFEMLKAAGAVQYVESGKQAGCWVMKAEETGVEAAEDDPFAADKILVKSDGIITYAGKDIAYHLWKLNRITRDFAYQKFFAYHDGRTAWITAPTGEDDHPRFGHGTRYVNVIDFGQSYVQDFVKRAVLAVAPDDAGAAASTHLGYEKVGLTVATCDELGYELAPDERTKSFVSMSGRKGRGVIVDDLIDRLEASALEEVHKRDLGYEDAEQRDIAHKIAVGALRYFLMKFTRNSVIAFDFKEALSFEGETGPYIQYAAVRIKSIFTKLAASGIATDGLLESIPAERFSEVFAAEGNEDFWPVAYLAAQLPDAIDRAVATLEPAVVAKYAFELAQLYSRFNHKHRILTEQDEARRAALVEISRFVRTTLVAALATLGIEVPDRM